MSKHWYTNGIEEGMFIEGNQPTGWNLGRSKSVINKISQTETGKKIDPEIVKRVAEKHRGKPSGMKGKHQSDEAKAKISKASKGRKQSEEAKQKLSKARKGIKTNFVPKSAFKKGNTPWNKGIKGVYHPTEETKQKTSKSLKGRKRPEEFCLKMKELANSEEIKLKIYKTKKQNHSFNTSSYEDVFYSKLLLIFDSEDIIRQYYDDRYPFNCDFYIKSKDLFIELNLNWTHGEIPFDSSNAECQLKLSTWKQKSITSQFYLNAIDTWTVRDVNKLNILKANNLNYLIAYNQEDMDKILNYLLHI